MTAEDVRKNLLALPWVKPVKGAAPCEGIKWASLAMKDVGAAMRGELPVGHRSRCKRRAKFVFRATKRTREFETRGVSGAYCTTHASQQILEHGAEYRRANAWWDKNGWWLNGVFGKHEGEV